MTQVHAQEKSFHCSQCDKSFKELRTLRLHLKIHNSEYPEHCEVCKKGFRTKWQVTLIRCFKGFKSIKHFVLSSPHLTIHHVKGWLRSSEQRYIKTYQKFSVYYIHIHDLLLFQLKQHLMDHGGKRPYPCPECTFTCKTKQQLNEHRRKHSVS